MSEGRPKRSGGGSCGSGCGSGADDVRGESERGLDESRRAGSVGAEDAGKERFTAAPQKHARHLRLVRVVVYGVVVRVREYMCVGVFVCLV